MFEDNDDLDDDFNPEEAKQEYEAERKRIANLPIVKKVKLIFDITSEIVDSIDPEQDILRYREFMMEDAMIMNAKIAGAEGGDLYNLRMENAVIIKIHAKSLMTYSRTLKYDNILDSVYLDLLYKELEEFRLLFIDWVKSFDSTNNIPDGWGIFDN
jgi:hypothetical protein